MLLDQRRSLTARQISRLLFRGDAEAIPDPEARARAIAAADRQVNWFILMRRAMRDGWQLRGWRDDRDLAQLTQQGATAFSGMVPDAVFVLSLRSDGVKDDHFPFILELDRGTESIFSVRHPLKDWTAKIERYLTYLGGPIQQDPLWRGIAREPRVLTLTATASRRDNLLAATAAAGGDDRFWFATYQPLLIDRDPVPLFWQMPWQVPSALTVTMADFLDVSVPSLVPS